RGLPENFLEPGHQGGLESEEIFHTPFQGLAVRRVDVELRLLRFRLEVRVLHRVHERLAQDLDTVLRRSRRQDVWPRRWWNAVHTDLDQPAGFIGPGEA